MPISEHWDIHVRCVNLEIENLLCRFFDTVMIIRRPLKQGLSTGLPSVFVWSTVLLNGRYGYEFWIAFMNDAIFRAF